MELSADSVEQYADKNIVIARGHVVVKFGSRTIKADRISVNTKTGSGEARGNVIILDEGTRLRASKTTFNVKSKQGRVFNAKGLVGKQYRVKGQKVTRVSETHYEAIKASLTTCRGSIPDWEIQTDSADLKLNDRALFKKGVFKIRDVPVAYVPVGYVPLNNDRKSGFLFPTFGNSNQDGFTFSPAYYWAINRHSDATFTMDVMSKRGVRPGIEYRYTPSRKIAGEFRGSMLQDNVTDNLFYKVYWTHNQIVADDYVVKGKLDLVGDNNFDKTFTDDTSQRTRRSTDSFLSVSKAWRYNSLDITTRFRDSIEDNIDSSFGQLPQVIFKTQRHNLGKSNVFFKQETSYSGFFTDLDLTINTDDTVYIHRFDFHPQVGITTQPFPWLSVTPTVGFRETLYSTGIINTNERTDGFSRELFDVNVVMEGPKINKVYHTNSSRYPKLKHLIEPRVTYDYIPGTDDEVQDKILAFDSVDLVRSTNRIKYFFTQKLLQKESLDGDNSQTNQLMRFEVSQSYNLEQPKSINEFTILGSQNRTGFSDIRFDFDSRFWEPLMVNVDSTWDFKNNLLRTFNVELGIQPIKNLSFYVERRFTRDISEFLLGTVDYSFGKGWRVLYSTRYDILLGKFQENDISVRYDNKCRCWGFGFDFIDRRNINSSINQNETKFLFTLELRGLGSIGTQRRETLLHRDYKGSSIF